jgi:hypothetical protein
MVSENLNDNCIRRKRIRKLKEILEEKILKKRLEELLLEKRQILQNIEQQMEELKLIKEKEIIIESLSESNKEKVEIIEIIETIEEKKEMDTIKISNKEKENYIRQKDKCKFKSAEEEYEWAKTQEKKCSKCKIIKTRIDFTGNTSGTDAFDRNGYRLLRPECKECKKKSYNGKTQAIKNAKTMNIQHKPPEGTLCSICQEPEKKGDAIVFDHDHLSNTFRGYCHNSCNRSLGVLGDNVEGLIRAINYLNKSEKHKIIQDENGMLKII